MRRTMIRTQAEAEQAVRRIEQLKAEMAAEMAMPRWGVLAREYTALQAALFRSPWHAFGRGDRDGR